MFRTFLEVAFCRQRDDESNAALRPRPRFVINPNRVDFDFSATPSRAKLADMEKLHGYHAQLSGAG